jgi:16S rRNA (guanine527-N7)-methyltransferase
MTVYKESLSDERIAAALTPYGFSPSTAACERIRTYIALLLRWNQRISLTALTSASDILQIHFGESIFATSAVPIREGRLADVGTGGGFPGIPIKIARPDVRVLLIEPNIKKCAFLSEVLRALQLDAEVIRGRMESAIENSAEINYITSRAVGQWDEILKMGARLDRNGQLVLWVGGEIIAELTANQREHWSWKDPIKIPETIRRFLLVGKKL